MLDAQQTEELICLVAAMDRENLLRHFREYPATFPIDFTPEFLETVALDRLRHIFVALCLQCQHVPDTAGECAPTECASAVASRHLSAWDETSGERP